MPRAWDHEDLVALGPLSGDGCAKLVRSPERIPLPHDGKDRYRHTQELSHSGPVWSSGRMKREGQCHYARDGG